MSELVARVRRYYTPAVLVFDVVAWVLAYVVGALVRYSRPGDVPWGSVLLLGLITGILYLAFGSLRRLHQGRARTGSLHEIVLVASTAAAATAVVFTFNAFVILFARAVPIGAAFFFIIFSSAARVGWRYLRERDLQFGVRNGTPVLVIGAGEAAQDLIRSMRRDPKNTWRPIGLLDDDPRKRHLHVDRVPVVGGTSQLAQKANALGAEALILAIPGASRDLVGELGRAADDAGLPIKILPSQTQLLSDRVGIRDLRDINLTDVLGRNQLDTDVASIADYLTGKRVLVTGAGGSIGSELCRQIHRFDPAELMMLDRDESALHAVQLSIHGRALLDSSEVVLCDIRDESAVRRIFADRRPQVVFHAAALKHLTMLEQYPDEAVKTNIVGTRHILEAAALVGVERFVNISTDKAANPSSVLGYSKRIAERLTAGFADADGTYLSVRFGNVLGSRGSVLTAFAKQIADGGPVTVTDPDVTRYFMTIEEACQLVVQAGAIGEAGEALVLDMGEPVRIVDVARQLIEQDGRRIPIEFTGLRPGEKMHEELFADDEPRDVRPQHPLVSHVPVPAISEAELEELPRITSRPEVTARLAGLCATGVRGESVSTYVTR